MTLECVFRDSVQNAYPDLTFLMRSFKSGYIVEFLNENKSPLYVFVNKNTPSGCISLYTASFINKSNYPLTSNFLDELDVISVDEKSLEHIPMVGVLNLSVKCSKVPHKDPSIAVSFFNDAINCRYPKYKISKIAVYSNGAVATSESPKGLIYFKENSLEFTAKSYEVFFEHGKSKYEFLGILPFNAEFTEKLNDD